MINTSSTDVAEMSNLQIYIVDGLLIVQEEINAAISRYNTNSNNRRRPPASSADDNNPFKVGHVISPFLLITTAGAPPICKRKRFVNF